MTIPLTVHPYRPVVAVTATHEVLSCGHELPRFDATPAFEVIKSDRKRAMYPRSRRCHHCLKIVDGQMLAKVDAPTQMTADWVEFASQTREAYLPGLLELLGQSQRPIEPNPGES